MNEQKEKGLWIRLNNAERDEIEKEAELSGFSMSDIARQRLFSDPAAKINAKLEILERRSLSILASNNLIIEIIESIFPEDKRLGKKLIQSRLNILKGLVLKAESVSLIENNNVEQE